MIEGADRLMIKGQRCFRLLNRTGIQRANVLVWRRDV